MWMHSRNWHKSSKNDPALLVKGFEVLKWCIPRHNICPNYYTCKDQTEDDRPLFPNRKAFDKMLWAELSVALLCWTAQSINSLGRHFISRADLHTQTLQVCSHLRSCERKVNVEANVKPLMPLYPHVAPLPTESMITMWRRWHRSWWSTWEQPSGMELYHVSAVLFTAACLCAVVIFNHPRTRALQKGGLHFQLSVSFTFSISEWTRLKPSMNVGRALSDGAIANR